MNVPVRSRIAVFFFPPNIVARNKYLAAGLRFAETYAPLKSGSGTSSAQHFRPMPSGRKEPPENSFVRRTIRGALPACLPAAPGRTYHFPDTPPPFPHRPVDLSSIVLSDSLRRNGPRPALLSEDPSVQNAPLPRKAPDGRTNF